MKKYLVLSVAALILQGMIFSSTVACKAATTELISVSSTKEAANGSCSWPGISDDGRYVSFESAADNLVEGDTNEKTDIFIRDLQEGTTIRVSVSSSGEEANDSSSDPEISGNGRFVMFMSYASNLVEDDNNGYQDVFLHDLQTGTTVRVNVSSTGEESNDISSSRSISRDGSIVSFSSYADNLVPDDTNGISDAFIHYTFTGITERVSISNTGEQVNGHCTYSTISSDGRYVAFKSEAINLVPELPIIYPDFINAPNVFIRDLQTGLNKIVSLAPDGITAGNDRSSWVSRQWDGQTLIFGSYATNLVPDDNNGSGDLFAYYLDTGVLKRISVSDDGVEGNGLSTHSSVLSGNGRYVVYYSNASNLIPNDLNDADDSILRDLVTDKNELLNISTSGEWGNARSCWCAVNWDGRYAVFESDADNLVAGDVNEVRDIFLRTRDLDDDADGFDETVDCDDSDANSYPGAPEICDNADNDCDGMIDDGDSDGDGVADCADSCPDEDANGFDIDNDGCIDDLGGLAETVATLVIEGVIDPELENSLISKIENAEKSLTKENICAAVNQLESFQNQINAQRGHKISEEAADLLIAYSDNVIAGYLNQLPPGDGC